MFGLVLNLARAEQPKMRKGHKGAPRQKQTGQSGKNGGRSVGRG